MSTWARRVWYAAITAIIIQSVWIGGGFGTGREIVEFIAKYGVYGGAAIVAAAIVLVIATYLTLEVARKFRAYDYMSLSKQFLWKAWPLFDIAYIVLAWIVIAVVAAAAASILEDMVGIPYIVGAAIVIAVVGLLHFFGRKAMEAFWVVGTVGLYIMYVVIWALTLSVAWPRISENLARGVASGSLSSALVDGFRYTMYNLLVLVPALQSVDRYRDYKDSVIATIIATVLVYGAATIIWLCFMGFYPEIIPQPVPWYFVLKKIGISWALGLYVFWIFYTLMETALGMIYGLVRRITAQLELRGRKLTRKHEALIAVITLIIALVTSQAGIVALVAKGYGTMAWVFFAVYFIPLVTIGAYRLARPEWKKEFWEKA